MHDKNLMGDVFVPGNPLFFDNEELYKRYKEWEAKGFPCEDYLKADVVEVKHGQWINKGEKRFVCSECHTRFIILKEWKWCPVCGARMDGDEE